jgi:hypothetical protein
MVEQKKKYFVAVHQIVTVEIDETKFDDAFMEEFREGFYPFTTIGDHVKHIGQLEARGLFRDDFVEGYGPPKDMGIKVYPVLDWDTEILDSPDGTWVLL